MVDFANQAKFTDALPIARALLVKTVVGQAHFAGTGPEGALCRQCKFWGTDGGKRIICAKYRSMTGDGSKAIPPSTPSCRYFDARPSNS